MTTTNFTGIYLEWIGTKAGHYGQATVTLDAGTPQTVDCHRPSTCFQAGPYSTGVLADGPHTPLVEWAPTKNPASSYYYISVDAFDVMGTLVSP